MDGEEDDFMSASHSDDGGGTPVMDEHPASDGEEMRSDRNHSEDEGSNDEDARHTMETSGAASGSDNEDRRGGDSDSEGEAPRGRGDDDDRSDSEAEPPRPADSDDDSPVKRGMSASDNEEESPVKHGASDNEEGEAAASPVKRRGSSSDMEDGEDRPKAAAAADSDSDNEDAKPAASAGRRSNADSDSDTEMPARRKAAQIDSDEDEEAEKQQGDEEGGGGGGKWKAVMQSDSEEEEEGRRTKAAAGSDGEQQEVKRKKAILSDSEDEDEEKADKPAAKRSRAVSDDENSDSDGASGGPDKSLAAKLRELGSDSESEDERSKVNAGNKDEKALFGSDSDSGDEEEKMIADIFGESGDEEGEEFTGFNQEDLEGDKKEAKEKQQQVEEDSDSDEGVDRSGQDTSFMSDFDIMLARKKAMNSKRRRHRDGGTFISDADDVVSAMITKMNEAAEEDRTLNSQKKPALKKLSLLSQVVMHLKKQDLKETFIDSGVMSAIKEWISPLPDKSLPALRIREELLRILQELPSVSQETLKHSGIGRAVMFLYKHPKESRSNKDLALKLINEWSRPIFGLTSNYKGMTREERQQRDLDQQMPQRRRLSSGGQTPRRDLEKQLTGEEKALRPGDPGFCARARVPMPSNKDYVVRPKWNVEMESNRGPMKKGLSRVDKQMRRFADIRRLTKTGHAVKISVEGNRMPL
ncbi:protein IWS1 homolog isoform X3 [Thunnus albacares]|uniref:protein IWS1 homolog isoform X3 n=1 Tax=Thunnus albacares TaxID=8236 RepID=UPI001CF6F391|nr:protein IWS1 homolog isoform X3 [Thunnus albacares]